jgi:hypothetical protein
MYTGYFIVVVVAIIISWVYWFLTFSTKKLKKEIFGVVVVIFVGTFTKTKYKSFCIYWKKLTLSQQQKLKLHFKTGLSQKKVIGFNAQLFVFQA